MDKINKNEKKNAKKFRVSANLYKIWDFIVDVFVHIIFIGGGILLMIYLGYLFIKYVLPVLFISWVIISFICILPFILLISWLFDR